MAISICGLDLIKGHVERPRCLTLKMALARYCGGYRHGKRHGNGVFRCSSGQPRVHRDTLTHTPHDTLASFILYMPPKLGVHWQ